MPNTSDPAARVNGSDAFKLAVADFIGGNFSDPGHSNLNLKTQTIHLHSGDPGFDGSDKLTGADYDGPHPVTWGVAASEGANGRGKITGSNVTFNVPGGIEITHYSVWAGTTYLYGKSLNPTVSLSAKGKVTITPTHAYGLV